MPETKPESDVNKARRAIITHCQDRRGVAGQLPCPVCGRGTLRYRRAKNGHVHAICNIDQCVRWIE